MPMAFHPPTRCDLVSQTVRALRSALAEGVWGNLLPGEHRLCSLLHVSRTTLRAALQKLEEEGLIQTAQGQRRRIVEGQCKFTENFAPRKFGILSSEPLDAISQYAVVLYHEIFRCLRAQQCEVEFYSDRRLHRAVPDKLLRQFVEESRSQFVLLFSVHRGIQRWFQENKIPAFVVGHRYEGIDLPALDIDNAAISRHAAAAFLARGHQQFVLLRPKTDFAGDLVTEDVFVRTLEADKRYQGNVTVLCVEMTREGHNRTFEHFLRLKHLPTAVFISNADCAIAFASRLQSAGMKIPHQVSIVSRESNMALDHFHPDITRYGKSVLTEARKLATLLTCFVTQSLLRPSQDLIMPDFHRGATLGPVPAGLES